MRFDADGGKEDDEYFIEVDPASDDEM